MRPGRLTFSFTRWYLGLPDFLSNVEEGGS
jgi:hypothetical protein